MAALSETKAFLHDPVKQFSVFTANKVGRLSEFVALLSSHDIHLMALATMDTTESAILRIVVDDPDAARALFLEHGFPFTESDLLVVELQTEADLKIVLAALLETEINIHYLYPFIFRPHERAALAMHLEDMDLAVQALRHRNLKVLAQSDISR